MEPGIRGYVARMDVVIAGGHGKIALRLEALLAREGHHARGLIRNPDHAPDLEAVGAEAVVCDLEAQDDLLDCVRGADAVVFAAGAGPGSGPERKRTVDLGAAVKLVDAAKATGVRRYVIVSSMGADDPSAGPEPMRPYLEAKAEADRVVASSGLYATIVRPGGLTDEPGTGRVDVAEHLGRRGQVARDDVAAVLHAVLQDDRTIGRTFELLSGDTPIAEALQRL
jgi:uncharacterized protein YbjT (DUF2867 family)